MTGTHLAYSGGGGRWIQIWDPVQAKAESGDAGDMEERFAKQGTTRYLEHKLDKDILKLVLSPTRVFISSANGLVREYDISSMQEVRQYDPLNDWAFGLAFHQSTQRLAAGSFRGQIKIWDANTGRELISFIGCPSVKSPKRKKY